MYCTYTGSQPMYADQWSQLLTVSPSQPIIELAVLFSSPVVPQIFPVFKLKSFP